MPRALATKVATYAGLLTFWASISSSLAAPNRGSASPGPLPVVPATPVNSSPAFDAAKHIAEPLANFLTFPIVALGWLWDYIILHPAAAGLLTAVVAGIIAVKSIHTTRSVARLRETFNTFTGSNWDSARVNARKLFSEIKKECEARPQSIADYYEEMPVNPPEEAVHIPSEKALESVFVTAFPPKSAATSEKSLFSVESSTQTKAKKRAEYDALRAKHQERVIILRTILNDYENIALGIKLGILDEDYAYRYYRGTVIDDYQAFKPLIDTYQARRKNKRIYIEFEALYVAWEANKSYRTDSKLSFSEKQTKFKPR